MIHSSSLIHPDARIDPSVEIGPFCSIGPQVSIGAGSVLKSHVVIEGWTEIGEHNVIYPFSVLGAKPQDLKYQGENTKLIIGNHNTIREGVTINLGTAASGGETRIGNHCLIMGYSHIGHDCVIGNSCILANYAGLAGHVVFEDFVTLGGMCGVSQYVRLGAYSYVGGYSGLERDVPPFSIVVGTRPTLLKGTNVVGLKRRGFPPATIQKISEALKLWERSETQKEECLKKIGEQGGSLPEIQHFIHFVRKTEVGLVR